MKRDVDKPESIADHMYRMGLMALIAADIPGVNRDKYSTSFYFFYLACIVFNLFTASVSHIV